MTGSTKTKETGPSVSVAPFGMEADHPRCADLKLQCIPNARLRSALEGTRPVIDSKTGEAVIPQDQMIHLGSVPRLPGMQIHVNPAKLTYLILDPLTEDEDLSKRLTKWLNKNSPYRLSETVEGVPQAEGTLDKHQMKSLCRELLRIVEAGEGKWVKGAEPTLKDIEQLPGEFLLNPGSVSHWSQPTYEKDYEAWKDKMTLTGG